MRVPARYLPSRGHGAGDADSAWRTCRGRSPSIWTGHILDGVRRSFPSLSSVPHYVFARAASSRWLLLSKERGHSFTTEI
jgi:hypothetical protein